MSLRFATILALSFAGTTNPGLRPADEQQAGSVDEKPLAASEKDSPQIVVAAWLDLVVADNLEDSWTLTTGSEGLAAHHEIWRMKNKRDLRVERSLGNDSVSAVVTNTVAGATTESDRAFLFWLVKQDGAWRIDTSYVETPRNIDQQLQGFLIGGRAKWHVTRGDLLGTWVAGPGPAAGLGGIACGSRFKLQENGRFALESWGPAGPVGPDGEANIERGSWRLSEDLIIRHLDGQTHVSRISWMASDSFRLTSAEKESARDGRGTSYELLRE